jgi:hypothetical protein
MTRSKKPLVCLYNTKNYKVFIVSNQSAAHLVVFAALWDFLHFLDRAHALNEYKHPHLY